MLSNCTKRLGASCIHLILFVISIIAVICSAQPTILSPSCVPDPSDPRKNILEITGNNYSSTSFSITSTVDNCHLYIHDLLVTSIKITSTIINNSNITIRNVSSSNNSIATFIWFTKQISNFSFVDFNSVSHSSLSIDTSKTMDRISIVEFGPILGKSDLTSRIHISGLRMNDVFCNRSAGSSDSNVCYIAMICFRTSVTNVGTFTIENFGANNISMNSFTAMLSELSVVNFFSSLSVVQKISIANVEIRNVFLRNSVGSCFSMLLYFMSPISGDASSTTSEFTIRDVVVENFNSHSERATSTLGILGCTTAHYNSMTFSNISAISWNSTAGGTSGSYLRILHFISAVSAFSSSPSSSKFIVDNIRLQGVSAAASAMSELFVLFAEAAISNFSTVQFTNITASSLRAIVFTGYEVGVLNFRSTITAPDVLVPSSSATMLLVNDVHLENASSTSTSSDSTLFVLYLVDAVTGFRNVQISNVSAVNVNATSRSTSSTIFLVRFDSAIAAPVLVSSSSPSSSLNFFNLRLQNSSASGGSYSRTWLISLSGQINNYNTFQVADVSVVSVNTTATTDTAEIMVIRIYGEITAPDSLDSSMLFSNILVDTLCSSGKLNTELSLFYDGSFVTNFNAIKISDVAIRDLNSTSNTATSIISIWVFAFDITAPASSNNSSSSLIVNDIEIERVTSTAKAAAVVYCFLLDNLVHNYSIVKFTNISATSIRTHSSSDSSTLYFLHFVSFIVPAVSSSVTPTSLLFINIQLQDCVAIAETSSELVLLAVINALENYNNIQFTNFTAVSLNSTGSSSYSQLYILLLRTLVAASPPFSEMPTTLLQVNNIWVENISSATTSTSQMYIMSVQDTLSNFNALRLSNITVISAIATSTSDQSSLYLIRFDSSVTAPASKFPSVRIDNIWMQNCSVTAALDSELWFVAFVGSLIDYREVELANFTALSLNANSSDGGSSVYLAFFFSSISSAALSPSSMSISNLRLQNATSIGNGRSQVFTFHVGGAVNNVNQIAIRNVSSSNVFASSTILSIATYYAVSFGGLSNCSSLLVETVQMSNISSVATGSSNSWASSTVALLYFDSVGTYKNISLISVQHCTVRQVSVFSHGQSAVRLVETDIPAEAIVVNNNSLLLHASTGASFSASQTISAALVGLSFVSSRGFKMMRVTNNVLNILDQTWKEICAPANCSMVRINKVQRGSNNNNNNIKPSTISLTGNELVNQNSSSFISFAKYAADSASDILNFVLEDNMARFGAGPSSTSSLLGFDESSTPSSSFPALVHVEVKCNEWPRTVDRDQQQLLSNAFSRLPLRDFIDWTCRSHSVSKNASRSVSAAASSSFSPSVVSSTSLSLSIFLSKTKSSDISSSLSISASASPDRSRSASNGTTQSATCFKNPSPFILKISEPVNSALLVSDGTQAAAMVSVAVFSSIAGAPALGFTIGRQQAMMDFAQKSLRGDCRGLLPSTTVKSFEDEVSNPLGLSDSPTQLSIGGSEKLMSYYVGAVVGNCVLIVCLVAANQGIGMGALKFLHSRIRWIRKFVKKNTAASMLTEQCGSFNKKEPLKKIMRRVFAKSYVSLTLFFCLSFLLTPTLSSALIVLVAAKNDPELEGQQVSGYLKLVSLVCAIAFSIVALYFVAWSVKLRRKRKEKFRSLRDLGLESHRTERTIAIWLFKARGEWRYPPASSISVSTIFSASENNSNAKNDKKLKKSKDGRKQETNYNDFLIAEPAFESYRTSVWFSIVEIATAIALALPPFVAQFASSAKSSCLLEGIMLLIILLLYTTLLIWKNPFKLRILRIANPILSMQQLVIVVISLISVVKRNGDDSNATAETPAWFWRILMVPLGFQSLMSVLMMGAAVFPILMFLKKLRGRAQRRGGIQINNHDDVVPSHQITAKTAMVNNQQKLEGPKRNRTKRNGNAHNNPRIRGNDADEIAMEVQI